MANSKLNRRVFLKALGTASAGLVLAACAPATPAPAATTAPTKAAEGTPTAAAPQIQGKLQTYWGNWTPTESMTKSEDNPNPHNKLIQILDAYKAKHPGVEIEWIKIPQGTSGREWTTAQQVAGTIPHIMAQSYWQVKEDLDKDWWVELTPFMEKPNPYIPKGDPGSEKWLDQLFPIPTGPTMFRNGYWNLNLGLVTTFFYYNIDWFEKAGAMVPKNYKEFLDVLKLFKNQGVNAYGGWVGPAVDTDHWYRIQLGGMLMARDIEPKVNPKRGSANRDMVACAIKSGTFNPRLPQYKEWMELWKLNVPYRSPDWANPQHSDRANFLKKTEPIMENANWILPALKNDPLMDFKWGTFYAPPLTQESSLYVTTPPTPAWPIGGPSGDQFAVSTRSKKDGVLPLAIDLMQFIMEPNNLYTIQGEIGETLPNVKGVPVDDALKDVHKQLSSQVGETQMFVYENDLMDDEVCLATGTAWRSFMLDKMSINDAITSIDDAWKAYVDRYMTSEKPACG